MKELAAPKGNKFWLARSSHGANPKFDSPETLWSACLEYFEWVENNPLLEMKAFHASGVVVTKELPKMRAMTLSGLCNFLDICDNTWTNYKEKQDFLRVTKKVEQIIKDQKFSGAAADLLNANIIARDLGLVDKQEKEHKGKLQFNITEDDADL